MNTLPHSARNLNLYTIYVLIDPRDQAVRYVGITYDIYRRMRQHSRCEGANIMKNAWIQELQEEQLMFIMHSLEKVPTIEEALQREQYWIQHFLQQGASLTNIIGKREPSSTNRKPSKPSSILTPDLAEQMFFRTSAGQMVSIPEALDSEFDTFIRRYVRIENTDPKWDKAQRRHAITHLLQHGITPEFYDAEGELLYAVQLTDRPGYMLVNE